MKVQIRLGQIARSWHLDYFSDNAAFFLHKLQKYKDPQKKYLIIVIEIQNLISTLQFLPFVVLYKVFF